jgi:hypothetical protein
VRLQVRERQRDIRALPRLFELALHPRCVGVSLLRLQALPEAEQRPGIARVVIEVVPKRLLGLGRAAGEGGSPEARAAAAAAARTNPSARFTKSSFEKSGRRL